MASYGRRRNPLTSRRPNSGIFIRMLTADYRIEKQQSLRTTDSAAKIEVERWRVPVGSEWAMMRRSKSTRHPLPNPIGLYATEASSINPNATATSIPTAIPTLYSTSNSNPKAKSYHYPAATTSHNHSGLSASGYFQPYVPGFILSDNQWYLQRINVPRFQRCSTMARVL